MPPEAWSWVLTLLGCLAMILAGDGKTAGWGLALFMQPVWIIYSIVTDQHGFIVGALFCGAVHTRNLIKSFKRKRVNTDAEF